MTTGDRNISFRMATVNDVEALADLRWQMSTEYQAGSVSRENYIAAYREAIRNELAEGRHVAWLAEADGRAVACTMLIWWPMAPNLEELHRRRGYVSSVYTNTEYRRLGLARTLMEMLIAHARDLHIGKLLLSASTMGRLLYISMGFAVNDRALELALK